MSNEWYQGRANRYNFDSIPTRNHLSQVFKNNFDKIDLISTIFKRHWRHAWGCITDQVKRTYLTTFAKFDPPQILDTDTFIGTKLNLLITRLIPDKYGCIWDFHSCFLRPHHHPLPTPYCSFCKSIDHRTGNPCWSSFVTD